MIKLKRVYGSKDSTDGYRVLVDRLWPRGVSKDEAHIDLWLKEIAPSNALRQWFNHDPKKWPEFKERYQAELKANQANFDQLQSLVKKEKTLTLLFGAKDLEHNNAVVLLELLKNS